MLYGLRPEEAPPPAGTSEESLLTPAALTLQPFPPVTYSPAAGGSELAQSRSFLGLHEAARGSWPLRQESGFSGRCGPAFAGNIEMRTVPSPHHQGASQQRGSRGCWDLCSHLGGQAGDLGPRPWKFPRETKIPLPHPTPWGRGLPPFTSSHPCLVGAGLLAPRKPSRWRGVLLAAPGASPSAVC